MCICRIAGHLEQRPTTGAGGWMGSGETSRMGAEPIKCALKPLQVLVAGIGPSSGLNHRSW